MGIEDEWLTEYSPQQCVSLLSAFASMCRRNQNGKTRKNALTGGTVTSTILNIRSTFRTNFWPDPALDPDRQPSLFLSRQLAGYVDADPSKKQQKALPVRVFMKLLENNFTPLDKATSQLACSAFFYGM